TETLENLEKRQQAQQVDVERQTERLGLLTRLEGLKMARLPMKYFTEKAEVDKMKGRRNVLQSDLRSIEEQVAPALEDMHNKEAYSDEVQQALVQARSMADRMDGMADAKVSLYDQKTAEAKSCEDEHKKEVETNKERKTELARIQAQLTNLKNQVE